MFPRLLGGLVLFWVGWVASTPDPPRWIWPLAACLWLVPAVMLMRGTNVRRAAFILAFLSVGGFLWGRGGDDFFLWIAIILIVTEGYPHERALLLRVMVSVVYGFAVLSKLNPAWLGGDQLVRLANRADYLEIFLPVLASPWGRLVAVVVLVVEAALAIGLWFARTRVMTALVGLSMHLGLTLVASEGRLEGIFNLVPLNFGLVAMYLAFWYPLPSDASFESAKTSTTSNRESAWVGGLARQ